jgi:3-dehydroquinate synthase
VVSRSVEIKATVVAQDEREAGRRAILNFGHTVGHAIEALTRYETLHGEAVAVGMVAEARLGEAVGVTRPGTAGALTESLKALGLPTELPVRIGDLVPVMRHDKKSRGGTVRFALLERIGCAARRGEAEWTFEVGADALEAALRP